MFIFQSVLQIRMSPKGGFGHFIRFSSLLALFHCMVRYGSARLGTVRYGMAQFGSVCISTAVYIYIYIYAFSRRFYPKRLTYITFRLYIFFQYVCSLEIEPTTFALLTQCSNHWATGTHSLVPLKSGRDYSRVVIIAPPLLPWHHRKRATNKLTTKKGDGIVFFTLGMWMFLTAMERSMRMFVIYPPAAETVVTVTRAVEEESRDVFNSNGEVYENVWDLPPSSRDCGAVTRAVEEESRDVRAGVLR